MTETSKGTEFGAVQLKANAALYAKNKQIIDACSRYDSVDDAIAALTEVWAALEKQVVKGAEYTPAADLGFGSDNAAVIAESLLGRRNSVGATRKAFKELGK